MATHPISPPALPPSSSTAQIPTISLALPLPQLLPALRSALFTHGFLYLTDHGVPGHITSDLISILPALFSLSEDEKEAVALEKSPHFLGYSAVGAEQTAGKRDEREQFEFANELESEVWREGEEWRGLAGPNQVSGWLQRAVVFAVEISTACGDFDDPIFIPVARLFR
jgi:isopenicillin N synthase-like dioxygenase